MLRFTINNKTIYIYLAQIRHHNLQDCTSPDDASIERNIYILQRDPLIVYTVKPNQVLQLCYQQCFTSHRHLPSVVLYSSVKGTHREGLLTSTYSKPKDKHP